MEALKTDHQAAEALQAADLNRIEAWCQYLSDALKEQGYLAPYVPYTRKQWEMKDFPTRSEVDRIRHNVDQLQAGFASIYGWREIVYNNVLNFNQVNALEWDLQQLYACLQRILANVDFIRCGEFFGGEI